MPAVIIPAVIAGFTTVSATAGLIVWSSFSWAAFGTSLVLGGLSSVAQKVLGGGGKKGGGAQAGGTVSQSGITTQLKQPIISRKTVYGEIRIGGGIVFAGSSESNKYLHLVMVLAPHELKSIGEVWFDDYSIPEDALDGSGNVISGRYSGKVRIKKYLGTAGQSADANLVAECPEWASTSTLSGIAYLYVRLEWDQNIFPSGLPNISAWVKGKKIYDPRVMTTGYSNNVALICYDYLRDTGFGISASVDEVDLDFSNAAANTCDEFVTTENYDVVVGTIDTATDIITLISTASPILFYQTGDKVRWLTTGAAPAGLATGTDYYVIVYQRKDVVRIKLAATYADSLNGTAINITDTGSGTHTVRKIAEPRYTGALLLDSDSSLKENMESCLSGMAGKMVYSGGVFRILAASYQTPTVYFGLNDIISEISVQTKISQRERFNTVRGTYISPINDGQPSDYPQVTNATYKTQDGGDEIVRQIDFPATQRPHTAQRLAKVELEKSRQEITFSCDFNLSAFQVQVGDTAFFTIERFGWTDKIFEIASWTLNAREDNGIIVPYISMTMRETASAVYDWNSGEETSVDLAPNTSLPNPYLVTPVTGLSANSETVDTQSGDYLYKILLNWNQTTDQFVLNGGKIEIQYKKSTDLIYRPTYVIDGSFSFAEVTLAAQLNEEYDIRVRAVNQLGVQSSYTSILGFVVGSSGGVGSTDDWGNYVDSPSSAEDWGNYVDSPSSSEDWGFFT